MSDERTLSEVQADDLIERVLAGNDPEELIESTIAYVNDLHEYGSPYHIGSHVKINKPWSGPGVDGGTVALKKGDVVSITQTGLGEEGQDRMVLLADGKTKVVVPYAILGEEEQQDLSALDEVEWDDDAGDLDEAVDESNLTQPAGYNDPEARQHTPGLPKVPGVLTRSGRALDDPWPKGFPEKRGTGRGHISGTTVGQGAPKHDTATVQKPGAPAMTAPVTPEKSGKQSKVGIGEEELNNIYQAFTMMKEGAKADEIDRIDRILKIIRSGDVAEDALYGIYELLFSEDQEATLEDVEEKCKMKKGGKPPWPSKKEENKQTPKPNPITESKNPFSRFDTFDK